MQGCWISAMLLFCDWSLYHCLTIPQLNIEWNFWLVIWIAAAVAALAGVILGSPLAFGDYP